MDESLNHFKFAQFKFFLRASGNILLPPYKGSTLRGAFGNTFKKVVCVTREKACQSCLLKHRCVYSYVFETPPPPDSSKMRKYPYAPHPFVIEPPLEEKREYKVEEPLCFKLLLIGKSIDFLPYFIFTFDELGKMGIGKEKGKYQLEEVRTVNKSKERKDGVEEDGPIIYSSTDKILRSNFKVLEVNDLLTFGLKPLTLILRFLTPTRLKFEEKLIPTLEFHILFRNLLRRISLLSYFHCDKEINIDFKGLIEKSKEIKVKSSDLKWFDWERYSNRQEKKMRMGGFMGSVLFEGDFGELLPFLFLGEYIHVGKGTSFGLGKYEILNLF